ncbi:BZ3500_MvSof-1268-A1-R1_Chr1-1g01266 [Microbotryum saponariae]|uniref:BZ3500_MvSof-1268-A1-R1_Chr1-1g01266 protein n=1 Tax=Microbotryum saponariae TaxID=289078 RepID=A0A2X0K8Y3_9BASI|nr:BZ3500_MvSof-1268-A1-R1_Chr1-1g01266 [Microbotryum saponariae]SCZ93836.1 BZ3501_MvSof-1269-A2-R1_Chr1-1g00862 [Microbotryum saponariae]
MGFGELAGVLSILIDFDVSSARFFPFLLFGTWAGRMVQFEEREPIALWFAPRPFDLFLEYEIYSLSTAKAEIDRFDMLERTTKALDVCALPPPPPEYLTMFELAKTCPSLIYTLQLLLLLLRNSIPLPAPLVSFALPLEPKALVPATQTPQFSDQLFSLSEIVTKDGYQDRGLGVDSRQHHQGHRVMLLD